MIHSDLPLHAELLFRPELLAVAALGLAAGVMIGCIGIGGVVIVPVLVAAGYRVSTAISVAMAGYILTGVVGTLVYARHGTIDRRVVWPLCVGAMPAAILGAFGAQWLPPAMLELIIAFLTSLSGIQSLRRRSVRPTVAPRGMPPRGWAGLGAAAGLISSLTGTGGPAALMPMLLWLDVPILQTVGLAQVVQLPIGLLATAGNSVAGRVDLALGVALGLGLTAGARIGAEIAHKLNRRVLEMLVAFVLVGVGLTMLARLGFAALRP